ncbi:MAG: hypothetical protein LBF89_03100 [Bacteroidales bacterium]|nr:hypothetical protein [Bacteroidales bacterium]
MRNLKILPTDIATHTSAEAMGLVVSHGLNIRYTGEKRRTFLSLHLRRKPAGLSGGRVNPACST